MQGFVLTQLTVNFAECGYNCCLKFGGCFLPSRNLQAFRSNKHADCN